ncbi:Carcinine [Hypsibius exemplaris]|uniref:Carcinine n=1 Tax=Hypsibius exemplaris TaxID=2072580 RepID=A0A9X6NEN5_HYPEX|nr:Carcinine [Hypsibius exemplaris]
MDFDDVLLEVGEFGRYQQLLLIFFLLPPQLSGSFHGFVQMFIVAVPGDYWCRVPQAGLFNSSSPHMLDLPLELVDGKAEHSKCSTFAGQFSNISTNLADQRQLNRNVTIPCSDGWNYDRSEYETSIAMDWDLVCDHSFLPTLSMFIHTIGTLLGTVISGYLTDQIGRKMTFYIAAMIQLTAGVATVFSPNFIVFCVIRFLHGLTIVPVWLIPLIMALEFTGPSKRAPVGTTVALVFTFGVIGLGGLAYLLRTWVSLQLAVTLPFVFMIGYYWWMPESPRWLMSRGRFAEMLRIVRKMAKVNRAQLSEEYFEELLIKCQKSQTEATSERKYVIMDLFRTPNLRRKSCLIIFNSFANYAVYSGLNFFIPHLGGNDHIDFIYGALIELPAYPAMYFALNRFGRRVLLMFSMLLGGAFLIATALVPSENHLAVILLFLTSKFWMTFSFFVTDLVASELFPTVLRGAGASLTQTVSTIGLCLSPLIAHLGTHSLWLPLVIFGVLGMIGGLAALLLPETMNANLPETLEEAEEFGKDMTWKDYLKFGGHTNNAAVCGDDRNMGLATEATGMLPPDT